MKKPHPPLPLVCALLASLILTTGQPARGRDNPIQILLLPFRIFAPTEYAYLEDGIAATLNGRLKGPRVEPLIPTEAILDAAATPASPLTQTAIQTIAVSLGAELAVEGSVTIVGNAVSTTIHVWQVPGGNARLNYNAIGDRPEAVLEHIEQFIHRLNDEILTPGPLTTQVQSNSAPSLQPTSGVPPVSWQSPPITSAARGMAIADLGPEPGQEIAIINDHDLLIYKRDGSALTQIAKVKGKAYLRLVAVDAGDINGNGWAELFVTAFHTRLGQPRSFIVEWDERNDQFDLTFENLPTYFRILSIPSMGERLLGQPKGRGGFFGGRPTLMRWDNEYLMDTPVDLPPKVQIYDFILGPFLSGDDPGNVIALSQRKRIKVYQAPHQVTWASEESYGGSSVYLDDGLTPENQAKQLKQVGEETLKRVYLHPRMILKDVDKDGIQELLVVRNKDASGGLFRRTRLFSSGRIACLDWQPLGAVAEWETPKVSGHITDMTIADTDEDGQNELVYVVVDREQKKINSQQSYIVSHELTVTK